MVEWWKTWTQTHLPLEEPVLVFAAVMLIILAAPLLAVRFRLPGIIGLIVAGILVGPHAAGILERDKTIELMGTVGLLYIMFMAGLEVDLNQFFKYRNRSLVFGSLTFLMPQLIGTAMAVWLLGFGWAAAILLASMFASHTLVSYPIAARLGIAQSGAVTTAIGGTIITDTAALLVLAVVAAAHHGDIGPMFWGELALSLGIFVAAVLILLPRLGRWFFGVYAGDGGAEFVFVLAAGFTCAFFAEVAGVEAIIGAFLAGLALNRLIPHQGALMNRINFVGNTLFVPLFLLSVGMLVEVSRLVGGYRAWLVGGSMVVTVILTKWLAAWLTRKLLGYSRSESMVIYGLSVPQAAATLAAVFVGFEINLFDEEVLNGAVMMILFTCLLGPWLVEKYGREMALASRRMPDRDDDAPQRILVPLANPSSADSLMDLAFAIREPDSHESIYPLTIAPDDGQVEKHVAAGEKMLGHAVIYAAGADVPVIPTTRIDLNIANGIARAVAELRISNIIVGWKPSAAPVRRGKVFGSVLDQLLNQTRQSILFCHFSRPINNTQRLILVIPPSGHLQSGFNDAIKLCKRMTSNIGARLYILSTPLTIEAVRAGVKKIKPEVNVTFAPVQQFARLADTLATTVGEDDMILLLNSRRSGPTWQPRCDRLPLELAAAFTELNLLVLYPSELVSRPGSMTPEQLENRPFIRALAEGRTTFQLDRISSEQAIERMLETAFPDEPAKRRMLQENLVRNSREFSAEVVPGVVLIHAHVSQVGEPTVLLGISQTGLSFPRVLKPAHLVFALLNPIHQSPEAHLKTLAAIANLVRQKDVIDRLRAAHSPEDLQADLNPVDPAY